MRTLAWLIEYLSQELLSPPPPLRRKSNRSDNGCRVLKRKSLHQRLKSAQRLMIGTLKLKMSGTQASPVNPLLLTSSLSRKQPNPNSSSLYLTYRVKQAAPSQQNQRKVCSKVAAPTPSLREPKHKHLYKRLSQNWYKQRNQTRLTTRWSRMRLSRTLMKMISSDLLL